MTQIKIEVPANDHIALSAMADALQRIADERQLQDTIHNFTDGNAEYVKAREEYYGSNTEQLNDESEHASGDELDEVFAQAEQTLSTINDMVDDGTLIRPDHDEELEASIHHENTKHDEEFEDALNSTLDADGIPHDKRIHSKGVTRLADNTWRLRKRPADKTEEEWTTYIDSVKAELKAVQDIGKIPVATGEYIDQIKDIPVVTREEAKKLNDIEVVISDEKLEEGSVLDVAKKTLEASFTHHVNSPVSEVELNVELTPPVIEEPAMQLEGVTPNGDVAIEPPVAPVTPPTSLTPPVVEVPKVTTFQELMLYITSDAKKRGADNDLIKATLLEVDPALTAIPLISTRADLIPKFVTALEAKLK